MRYLLALLLIPSIAFAQTKKFIEFGWNSRETCWIAANAASMNAKPFDGTVFRIVYYDRNGVYKNFGSNIVSRDGVSMAQLSNGINCYLAAKPSLTHLTDNFLSVYLMPFDMDWFDDWSSTLDNIGNAAIAVDMMGAKGILLDLEPYSYLMWTWAEMKNSHRFTIEQYKAKIKQRGKQVMQRLQHELPDITLLFPVYYSFAGESARYELYKSFLEGMRVVKLPTVTIIDGFEDYSLRTLSAFQYNYRLMTRVNPIGTQRAFPVWPDLMDAATFQTTLENAAATSDKYVWVYNQAIDWWSGPIPAGYLEALQAANP
jgi:hypothetical protein